ncbi:MAG: ferredoxin reductase, partial [Devosia sp.]
MAARRMVARDICEFTLLPAEGVVLPGFEPGAHIAVETPSRAMRRYSLINDGSDPASYVIAIKREAASRGGSLSMHDSAPVGSVLQVDPPENSFALVPAAKYLLIAGGIGVTPILSMARKLASEAHPFRVIYCSRTAEEAAFLQEMQAFPGSVIHHDEGNRDKVYDFWDHFEEPRNEHVFC